MSNKEHNYEHWIETFSGHPIDPLNPEPHRIHYTDIAHALSNQCRFSGHTVKFYSVAQHSVHVSEEVELMGASPEVQMLALFHDASEAYLVDMPTPIKRQMPEYRAAEEKLQTMIERTLFPTFGQKGVCKSDAHVIIKKADLVLLATEARDLMNDPQDWKTLQGLTPWISQIEAWSPEKSKFEFLTRFNILNVRLGLV